LYINNYLYLRCKRHCIEKVKILKSAFTRYYKIGDVLGEGSFAVVKKAIKKKTSQEFAVKMINKNQLSEDDSIALKNEVEILNQIDHPNAIKLAEIFEDENFIYLVIELMSGGEV